MNEKSDSSLKGEKMQERTSNRQLFGFSLKNIFQITTSAAIGCLFGKGFYESAYCQSADFKKEYNLVPSIIVGAVAGLLAMSCYMVRNYLANKRPRIIGRRRGTSRSTRST
ncbi:MAG: hypothetical protein JW829_19820 [Pirellulales bacterium]|nr:hypothetical protein [Pirellulales bacterium]